MKYFKEGIILSLVSMLCTFTFVGIPVGKDIYEILTLVYFVMGLLLIMYFGIIKKNSKNTLITSIIYPFILFYLVGFVASNSNNSTFIAIGFLPGLIISVTGIIISKNNNKKYKIITSLVLNIIALLLSIISVALVIPNGGFILE